MSLSQTGICNLALVRIGIQQPIADITEQSASADACNSVYAHCVDSILRLQPWPFAQRYETLALVDTNPNDDWGYSYRFPTSMLRVGRLLGSSDSTILSNPAYQSSIPFTQSQDIPFVVASDVAGKLIYTDLSDAVVLGTANITNTGLFDSLFIDALAWRIASEVAMGLTKDSGIAADARNMAKSSGSEGYATGKNESVPKSDRESSFVSARD
jgi:hypothetical protein